MPQFAVHRNRNATTAGLYPYLLDIQNDLLDDLKTRLVAPLHRVANLTRKPLDRLMPVITVEGERYAVMTPLMAGIASSELGEIVGDASEHRREIVGAVDFLMVGV